MKKFRKKPIVIEAMQLLRADEPAVRDWIESNGGECMSWLPQSSKMFSGLLISTLEDPHQASYGDWIIKGVKGEFYPCKDEIFHMTYEAVDAS